MTQAIHHFLCLVSTLPQLLSSRMMPSNQFKAAAIEPAREAAGQDLRCGCRSSSSRRSASAYSSSRLQWTQGIQWKASTKSRVASSPSSPARKTLGAAGGI
ncbi:hypothetical protein C8J56DRAFT_987150 [Mycena floridula]|nr:hypothetical protein C8J56DRAFT_987150 [Mycena floridula]